MNNDLKTIFLHSLNSHKRIFVDKGVSFDYEIKEMAFFERNNIVYEVRLIFDYNGMKSIFAMNRYYRNESEQKDDVECFYEAYKEMFIGLMSRGIFHLYESHVLTARNQNPEPFLYNQAVRFPLLSEIPLQETP